MRLAVVGSRDFTDYPLMKTWLNWFIRHPKQCTIISGGAHGADSLAKIYAKEKGIAYREFPADWDQYGKSAGYRRNKDMVIESTHIIAFWDGESKGTKHTIDLGIVCRPTIVVPV